MKANVKFRKTNTRERKKEREREKVIPLPILTIPSPHPSLAMGCLPRLQSAWPPDRSCGSVAADWGQSTRTGHLPPASLGPAHPVPPRPHHDLHTGASTGQVRGGGREGRKGREGRTVLICYSS